MKILLVGGGGREHAILHAIAKSPRVDKIYVAPGNAGMADMAELVNIGVMEFDKLVAFAREHEIDLTVCSQDDPLCAGIVDAFEEAGLRIFGTRKNAAIIEGSKAFSKDLMKKYNIPTAAYETFDDPAKAEEYLKSQKTFEGFGKGPKALAMNVMLKKIDKDYEHNSEIKWNFTKFLIDRQGNVVARFEPTADMKAVRDAVAALI